jgi:CBS domain-containing protein
MQLAMVYYRDGVYCKGGKAFMKTVKDIMKYRGLVWSISPTTTVFEALEVMADKNVGALPVIESGKLVGIFSERDYARKVILMGRTSKETAVSELMTQSVFYIKPENTIGECMALMTSNHIRHLPVLDNDRIEGVITMRDLVMEIISEPSIYNWLFSMNR